MFSRRLFTIQTNLNKFVIPQIIGINSVRHGHRLRGKRPGEARSLQQRLADKKLETFDEEVEKHIDIGFPQVQITRSQEAKKQNEHLKAIRKDAALEKKARNLELEIDLDDVRKEWMQSGGQNQVKTIASHYGIFKDLFGDAFFTPRIPLNVKYQLSEDEFAPVCFGNVLTPTQAKSQPLVTFDARCNLTGKEEGNTLWTLILTNPDGHFKQNDKEYVHWFIGNIPNDDVAKGDLIVPYLQPFPPKGTGFHRHIFILYKQDKKIDFSEYKVDKINELNKRTFSTFDFYKKYQDIVTPGGLAFFQSDYDTNLTDFYHNVLNIKEPTYEYDFQEPFYRDEEYFPLREAFNLYLDRYRDQKQVAKEFLERKLKKSHPFDGPETPLKYPNAQYISRRARFETDLQRGNVVHGFIHTPSWQKTEIRKARLGWGRINEFK